MIPGKLNEVRLVPGEVKGLAQATWLVNVGLVSCFVSKCSLCSNGTHYVPDSGPQNVSSSVLRWTSAMMQQYSDGLRPWQEQGAASILTAFQGPYALNSFFSVFSKLASMLKCTFIFKAHET